MIEVNSVVLDAAKYIGSLGVFSAAIGYLIKNRAELRQLRLSTFHKYSDRYSHLMGSLVALGDFNRKFPADSPKDRELCLQLFFLFSEELFLAESERLLSASAWKVWEEGIAHLFRYRYFQEAWEFCKERADFSGPFEDRIREFRSRISAKISDKRSIHRKAA